MCLVKLEISLQRYLVEKIQAFYFGSENNVAVVKMGFQCENNGGVIWKTYKKK